MHTLSDETDFFQFGQADEAVFYRMELTETLPSRYSSWPTKQDGGLFKFDSFYF